MPPRATATQNAKDIEALGKDLERLKKIVVGNGDPGMDENVRDIKKTVDKLRDDFDTYRKAENESRRYWTRLIAGVLVAQFVAGLVAAAVILIRLAPIVDRLYEVATI